MSPVSQYWRTGLDPTVEPLPILIERGAWVDPARGGRSVPYKIYYPADDAGGRVPVVFWSHGLGGSRDGAGFISRFLCSHGYVVVHIQHAGTDSSLWEGKPGHPWDVIRATKIPRKAVLNRYRDVGFALDQFTAMAASNETFGPRADLSRIGMSGHSFGANTTQIMAGQKLGYGRRQYCLADDRFRCGILYSAVPTYNRKDSPRSIYGSIRIPLFHMTGTEDSSPVEGFGYTKRIEVFDHSGGPDQHLMVLQGGDHMVYNGSRGKLGDNPDRPLHENLIKMAALAFWDGYLKGDGAALDWLRAGGFSALMGGAGTYTFRA